MIRICRYGEIPNEELFARRDAAFHVEERVREIIDEVIRRGDAALLDLTERYDSVRPDPIEVTKGEFDEAMAAVEPAFLDVLREAADNIAAYHSRQKRESFLMQGKDGVLLGQKITPIEKVGLYVPNGTAPYPSTVLMDAIPAKIAGCAQLVMVTPPSRNGKVEPNILAAAKVAGVDRVFKVGGAQAIAALAYGTESIPAVYKIVGPGNAYVAEAKRQVFGKVGIDVVAGPSEVLLVSDENSDPKVVAADMLAQAEHDKLSSAVLVTDSMRLALAVQAEIERQLEELPREEIARAAIEHNSRIIVTEDLGAAIDIANEIAPEHLGLCVDEPFSWLDRVKNAGSIFLGRYAPEAEPHTADRRHREIHLAPVGGRFCQEVAVYLLYKRCSARRIGEDRPFRKKGRTGGTRAQPAQEV